MNIKPKAPAAPADRRVAFPCCEEALDSVTQLHDTCDAEGRWALVILGHIRQPGKPAPDPTSRRGMTPVEVEII